ncbi:hypothetical protein HYDPIDRAFT_93055 [Hydnomerulius pinastri MD-312]|uniref:N-terminal acetyltransferase A, auxiliary subunit n=1 Tax=Hydnomerulius pinastri MD-312 TaxID=994086 RepID=A0A0C9WEA0_9AGAM|nr:hypothetical protein HYDPIDRAFT_93055 [Hydnomerulius pinastri MD-312]
MATQDWPQKDRKLFSELLQAYESKTLLKGRKTADQILKKYPDHGETMCMKGLIMVHLGEREEGKALAHQGMLKNPTSNIVWHVWALIQKGERNFPEALKAYSVALKTDKDNFNIIRETSILQSHTRQYEALVESRLRMLQLRPYARAHWVGLGLAYKLQGNLAEANRVFTHLEAFLRSIPVRDPEYGELILFHIRILEEMGELQQALTLLDTNAKERRLVDRPAIVEFRDSAQKAEWTTSAEQSWRELIDQNNDCYDYYKGLLANSDIDLNNLTEASREKALQILGEFSAKKANAPQRLALTVAEGNARHTSETFKERVKPYLEHALRKGIPSLFSDIKGLYAKSEFKRQAIEEIVENIRSSEEATSPQPSSEPTYYLWTLYFLAQHYSYLQQYEKALGILDTALKHTPTLPELHMTKARVFKRAGDPYRAVQSMDEARKLDGQDRFVNTKSGKYRLRAGMLNEAEEVFGMFTRKGAATPGADLVEMQALHYLTEVANASERTGKLNIALKRCYQIRKVFESFRDDQYDFHQYSIRKSILNPYTAMLQWEDNLRSHPAYIHAAVLAARIWVMLFDDPTLANTIQQPEKATELSKKALNKAKKAAARKATAESTSQDNDDTSKQKAQSKIEDKGLDAPLAKEDDPDGLKLVVSDQKLEQAHEFLGTVVESGRDRVDVFVALFDVAIRRKQYLQAARALRRAHMLDAQHPEVHLRIVHFSREGQCRSTQYKSILDESLAVVKPAELTLEALNSQYLQLHSTSPPVILACAKVSQTLDASRNDVENILFTALGEDVKLTMKDALSILSHLQNLKSPRADEFRIACDAKYKLSTVFKSAEEQAALRLQCIEPLKDNEVETIF